MKHFIFLILFVPLPLFAGPMRNVSDKNLSKRSEAAINLNFQNLSNGVSISAKKQNGSIIPDADSLFNIGKSGREWLGVYVDSITTGLQGLSFMGQWDGWMVSTMTWSRTGNYTFTIPADVTTYIEKGTRIRYTDGGIEYGVVFSASFGSGVTTITLFTNTDYAMAANPSIGSFSNQQSPGGYPGWFTYDCTPSGWSGTPTQTISRFSVDGATLFLTLSVTGTSNTTTAILYSPNTMLPGGDIIQPIGYAINNSSVIAGVTQLIARNNNTTIDFYTDMASAGWTASGTKRIDTTLVVQF